MKLEDFYKDQHYYELGRRDQLNTSLSFPTGVLLILYAGLFSILGEVTFPTSVADAFVLFFGGLALVAASVSAIRLFQASTGHAYAYPPTGNAVHAYRAKTEGWIRDNNISDRDIETEMAAFLSAELRACASTNADCNDDRSSKLHLSKKWVIIAILPAICMFSVHVVKIWMNGSLQ